MAICEQILGKSADELVLEDLINYFRQPQTETSTLEFKSGQTEPEKLFKEISGMLNTNGGLVILGAPVEREVENTKVCVGNLTPVLKFKNPESLAHKINANINPIPFGINIKALRLLDSNYIYLIEVPKSSFPPHQVSKKGNYYIRINEESIPAPHSIIESFFNRRQKPNLRFDVEIQPTFYRYGMGNQIGLKFNLSNSAETVAEDASFMIEFRKVRQYKIGHSGDNISNKKGENNFKMFHTFQVPLVKGLNLSQVVYADVIGKELVIECSYFAKNGQLRINDYKILNRYNQWHLNPKL